MAPPVKSAHLGILKNESFFFRGVLEGCASATVSSASKVCLKDFPKEARREIGFALQAAQSGDKHPSAKPLRGFGGAGVLEIVEDFHGDTYRAVYTVRFAEAVYVLHCFKKKSKRGSKTPKHVIELIEARLQRAEEDYQQWLKEKET